MIDLKKSPYGRDSKSYQIRLDIWHSSKLNEMAVRAGIRPTTAATQLLEAAIGRQYTALHDQRSSVITEKTEIAIRKLLRLQPGAYENGGFTDNPLGCTPYTRLDVVVEQLRDILAKDDA